MPINLFLICRSGLPAALLLFFVFSSFCIAAPFIIADPQADAVKFRMRLSADNGQTWAAWTEGDPVNGALRFDIGGTPVGNYKGEAQAGGDVEVIDDATGNKSTVWRWSDSAPFSLNVRTGTKPTKLKVTD